MDDTNIKLPLSQKTRLGICSLSSIVFFWYPNIFLIKFSQYDSDGRASFGIFCFAFLSQIFIFIFTLLLLNGYIKFLRANQVKRFYTLVIPEVLISLPTLAGVIYAIALFLIRVIDSYYGLIDILGT